MAKRKIIADTEYANLMDKINVLMSKGSKNVSKKQLEEIRQMALLAEKYEKEKYKIEPPSTLAGMIEMKMYELKLKQKELARKLHVSDAKLSLIMNGKQKPDVDFLKAVHQELDVEAEFLLRAV